MNSFTTVVVCRAIRFFCCCSLFSVKFVQIQWQTKKRWRKKLFFLPSACRLCVFYRLLFRLQFQYFFINTNSIFHSLLAPHLYDDDHNFYPIYWFLFFNFFFDGDEAKKTEKNCHINGAWHVNALMKSKIWISNRVWYLAALFFRFVHFIFACFHVLQFSTALQKCQIRTKQNEKKRDGKKAYKMRFKIMVWSKEYKNGFTLVVSQKVEVLKMSTQTWIR